MVLLQKCNHLVIYLFENIDPNQEVGNPYQ